MSPTVIAEKRASPGGACGGDACDRAGGPDSTTGGTGVGPDAVTASAGSGAAGGGALADTVDAASGTDDGSLAADHPHSPHRPSISG